MNVKDEKKSDNEDDYHHAMYARVRAFCDFTVYSALCDLRKIIVRFATNLFIFKLTTSYTVKFTNINSFHSRNQLSNFSQKENIVSRGSKRSTHL